MTDRKFNGKIYKEYTFAPTKANAEYYKKNLKASGFNSRVVKVKNGYVVFARKA
jgi:hypothetical protein